MKFKSDIEVQAGLKDSSGAAGTSGQVLSSNGTTVSWINSGGGFANDVQNTVKAGVAINKGQAVYVTGADGTNIIVGLASNATEATSSKTLGLLNATVAINGFADVIQIGKLAGLDTSTAVVGDPVWLGSNGNLIYGLANKPYAPLHLVYIGIVTRVNANNGEIFVNVQNGFELKELHDVSAQTPANNNGIFYNTTSGLWEAKSISAAGGIQGSGTTNYLPKFTDSTALGDSLIYDNGTYVGIGTPTPTELLDVNGNFSSNKIILKSTNSIIGINTTDGSDNKSLRLTSSNDVSVSRGSYINLYGNENANTGKIQLLAGNVSGGNIEFYTGNVLERMRITADGNVGIGTTTVPNTLSVGMASSTTGKGISLTSSAGIEYARFGVINSTVDNTSYIGSISNNNFAIYANNSERMRITSAGYVGIGTSSPVAKLSVSDSANSTVASFTGVNGGVYSAFNIMTLGSNGNGFWRASTIGGNIKMVSNQPAINANGFSASAIAFGSDTSQGRIGFFTTSSNIGDTVLTESMRIDTNGYVGIGTTSPTAKLHVVGNLLASAQIIAGTHVYSPNITNSSSANNSQVSLSDSGTRVTRNIADSNTVLGVTNSNASSTGAIQTWSNSVGEVMRITSAGYVGIGTQVPSEKLEVFGKSNLNSVLIGNFDEVLLSDSKCAIFRTEGNPIGIRPSQAGSLVLQSRSSLDRDIVFVTGATPTERMTIKGTGNVGIGTTSPDQLLTVIGNVRAGGIGNGFLLDTLGFNYTNGMKVVNNYETVMFSGRGSAGYVIAGDNDLKFGFGTNYSAGESMRITSSGNVGIGTTAPSSGLSSTETTLQIQNGNVAALSLNNTAARKYTIYSGVSGQLGFYDVTGSIERMRITSGGVLQVNGGDIYGGNLASDYGNLTLRGGYGSTTSVASKIEIRGYEGGASTQGAIITYTNGTERMRVTQGGNVGIGTTAPSTKLDVVGAITASGGFFNSDIRLKEIVDYKYSVADINPITYLWKDGRDDKKHIGYSAQEVQKVMPDAVNEGSDGMLSVNYVEVLVAKIAKLEEIIRRNGLE